METAIVHMAVAVRQQPLFTRTHEQTAGQICSTGYTLLTPDLEKGYTGYEENQIKIQSDSSGPH